jgi:hypothetical protein
MSKAILEMPTPLSCKKCGVRYVFNCPENGKNDLQTIYINSRNPDCPLIIRGVCATCHKKDDCDYSGDSVTECECWEIKK